MSDSALRHGRAWFTIIFSAADEERLPCMYRAIAAFLELLQTLEDCHRICETINFVDEYDGNAQEQEVRIEDIIRRLPAKLRTEAIPA